MARIREMISLAEYKARGQRREPFGEPVLRGALTGLMRGAFPTEEERMAKLKRYEQMVDLSNRLMSYYYTKKRTEEITGEVQPDVLKMIGDKRFQSQISKSEDPQFSNIYQLAFLPNSGRPLFYPMPFQEQD